MFHPLASWRPLPMDGDEDTASTRPVQGPLPARTAPQPFQPRSFTCVSSSQLTERYRDMVGARSLYLFRLFVSVGTISRTQQHLLFAGAIRRLTGTPGALGVRFKNRMDRWGGDSKRARPLITVFQVHPSLRHKAINAQTRSDATSKRSSTHACLCGIASAGAQQRGDMLKSPSHTCPQSYTNQSVVVKATDRQSPTLDCQVQCCLAALPRLAGLDEFDSATCSITHAYCVRLAMATIPTTPLGIQCPFPKKRWAARESIPSRLYSSSAKACSTHS